jgi:hypothetical protein
VAAAAKVTRALRTQLDSYDERMAVCRAEARHTWRPWKIGKGVTYHGERKRSWWRYERYCLCGMRKTEVFDRFGVLVWRTYAAPDGYSLAGTGLGRRELAAALRLGIFARELVAEAERELAEARREQAAAAS